MNILHDIINAVPVPGVGTDGPMGYGSRRGVSFVGHPPAHLYAFSLLLQASTLTPTITSIPTALVRLANTNFTFFFFSYFLTRVSHLSVGRSVGRLVVVRWVVAIELTRLVLIWTK